MRSGMIGLLVNRGAERSRTAGGALRPRLPRRLARSIHGRFRGPCAVAAATRAQRQVHRERPAAGAGDGTARTVSEEATSRIAWRPVRWTARLCQILRVHDRPQRDRCVEGQKPRLRNSIASRDLEQPGTSGASGEPPGARGPRQDRQHVLLRIERNDGNARYLRESFMSNTMDPERRRRRPPRNSQPRRRGSRTGCLQQFQSGVFFTSSSAKKYAASASERPPSSRPTSPACPLWPPRFQCPRESIRSTSQLISSPSCRKPYGMVPVERRKRPRMEVLDRQPVLIGELLELRPLRVDDFDALFRVASDPLIWEQHPEHTRYQESTFCAFFKEALDSGGALLPSIAPPVRSSGRRATTATTRNAASLKSAGRSLPALLGRSLQRRDETADAGARVHVGQVRDLRHRSG